jgi:hypothetical protein
MFKQILLEHEVASYSLCYRYPAHTKRATLKILLQCNVKVLQIARAGECLPKSLYQSELGIGFGRTKNTVAFLNTLPLVGNTS